MARWREGGTLRRAPAELAVSLRERASGIVVETQRPRLRLRVSGFRRSWRRLCSVRL